VTQFPIEPAPPLSPTTAKLTYYTYYSPLTLQMGIWFRLATKNPSIQSPPDPSASRAVNRCREILNVPISLENARVNRPIKRSLELKTLIVLCVFLLCGMLVAGLWPFHSPRNSVKRLANANGLSFAHYGTVLSTGLLKLPSSPVEGSCSLEIWLQPSRSHDKSTILAFYRPENTPQFSLHQSDTYLALFSGYPTGVIHPEAAGVAYVGEPFRDRKLHFIAIASSGGGSRIYVDGVLAKNAPGFRLSPLDCTGELVLGTSPVDEDSWSGQLRGLAIYNQELTPDQVTRHFITWTAQGRPEIGSGERVLALYFFDEHQGPTIRDYSGSGSDLYIPERFVIFREKFLEPPWQEFDTSWSYCKSVIINIGGFIPFGFFLCAYLSMAGFTGRPVALTIILGTTVSLTIEVLQAYLPTRNSGITDLITNTLGTALGVWLYRLANLRFGSAPKEASGVSMWG